ncbi:MAG TPA: FG-GAP-like repeat-containing protein, partial [Kofleriaceae bacterium]|nr:FG-GAP-like repeat-containing protein [Kofleriaceae bacterium]
GWELATARIERSRRLGVPSFTSADELELSGPVAGRLIAIGGGEYRVEGHGQTVRVRQVGSGFEVDLGDGRRLRLGSTAASRHEGSLPGGPLRTSAWLVDEETNTTGERVTYQYTADQGQVYLARVSWGPGAVYEVTLTYAPRPDATTSYREGFRVVTARRLQAVQVHAFATERRAYHLTYDDSFPVSRLSQVGSTGRAGVGAWPTLTFDYATTSAAAVTPMPGVGSWRLNAAGTVLVDLDSDGAADLLQLADGGHSYRLNQNGTFGAALPLTGNTSSISVLQLQDIDGDARADLLLDTGAGWSVWRWSKTKWLLQQGTWPGSSGLALKNPATTRFADLNGDGLIDGIKWNNDNLSIHQATRTGLSAPRLVPKIGGAVLPTPSGRFLDTNGDGLDDYMVVAADRLDVYLGRGDGTFDAAVARAYPFSGTANPDDLHLADLDRDDLLDLVRVDLGTVRWFRGRADGSFATTPVTVANPEPLATDVVVTIGDVNGNGSQDVVWSSASNLWRLDLAGATTAGMLTRTRNGLGLDVSFTYRSAHSLSVDARVANDPWQYEVPLAMPVPVRKQTVLGPGETTRQLDYLVRDGYWDAVERRFGGFLGTIVTTWGATPAQTSSVQTRYHNGTGTNRLLRGKPLVEQVRNGSGQRLSITTNTWEAMLPTGLPDTPLARKAVLRESRTRYEEVTPMRESRVTYEYDALGRQRRAVDYGRLDQTGDDSVRETTYADDATYWVRDLLCEDKVLTPGGVVLSHRRVLYGDHTTTLAPCVIGKGWMRSEQAYLTSEARFVTLRAMSYDARGNAISVKAKGVARELSYDPSGLFLSTERVTLDDGRLLTWSAVTDPVLGVVTEVAEPNGHRTRARYDSLGRPVGFALDARPDHLVMQYDWQAPYPKTTLLEFDGPLAELGAPPASFTPGSRWRQTVEVTNGRGDVRYRAKRLDLAQWIISDYQERDPASRVVFRGQATLASALEHAARPAGMIGQSLTYDPLGRMLEQVLPTGAHRTYTYAPFERTVSEDGLAMVRHVLDGKGRLVRTERQQGSEQQAVDAAYDAAGRLTQMTINSALTRAFSYDSLGRLIATTDPDLGQQDIAYDDAGRVILETNATGQSVSYGYDAVGRLLTRDLGPDLRYRFHYDDAYESGDNLLGRLAWVEEPTGRVELSYDEAGRTSWAKRTVDTRSAWERTTYAPSGLVLSRTFDDGLALPHSYDAAGRVIGVGGYWAVQAQDASGAVLAESFGNGASAAYQRDALGQVGRVTVRDAQAAAVYDVEVTRNVWRAISAVVDRDGVGLDHDATFAYDPFARLTEATLGLAAPYQFSYQYDGLQNMVGRSAAGPTRLALLDGSYRYGENGAGPRQLTSVFDSQGALHTFTYDEAGRQRTQDGLTMEFDALDQLVRVTGAHKLHDVVHAYGYDGLRVRTQGPDGTTLWFSESMSERNGVREHDLV